LQIAGDKIEAKFEERLNRFVARVRLNDVSMNVHVPNSGRLRELLTFGARVILRDSKNPSRKYRYSLIMVYKDGIYISVDSLIPNKLMVEELRKKSPIFKENPRTLDMLEYAHVKPEVVFGDSRFDIALSDGNEKKYYIEIKGVTLVENNRAFFPDAPTARGTKHLLELARAKSLGFGAGVFFIIQRDDADLFSPNDTMDPEFGEALRFAAKGGVDVFAYKCRVSPEKIDLIEAVNILL